MPQLNILLISTVAFPVFGAISLLFVTIYRSNCSSFDYEKSTIEISSLERDALYQRWQVFLAQIGFLGGTISGIILAICLRPENEMEPPIIQVALWTWLKFSVPQLPSLSFGLEANWVKSSVVALTGGLSTIAVWHSNSKSKRPLSEDMLLAISLLYASGVIFIFAPNVTQAFLGWGAVSLIASVLFQLSHREDKSHEGIDYGSDFFLTNLKSQQMIESPILRALQNLGTALSSAEHLCVTQIWWRITKTLVNWLSEQVESLKDTPDSIRQLAVILWASAILFAWIR